MSKRLRRWWIALPLLLAGCHPSHDLPGGTGPINDPIADGKILYQATCVSCHLENGAGLPGLHPPLVGSERIEGPVAPLAAVVLFGLRGPIKVKGVEYNGIMPMWKDVLNDRQIAAILTYVRQAWNNKGGEVSPHEVSLVRTAHPHQNNFLTLKELEDLAREGTGDTPTLLH